MKTYYSSGVIKYKDEHSDEPYSEEYYSFIIPAKNKQTAKQELKTRTYNEFFKELGKDWKTKFKVNELYETSSDVRTS